MKRSHTDYTHMVRHQDGTYSGIHSVTHFESIAIYKSSTFIIAGYHRVHQRELIELLFLSQTLQGIETRRLFDDCTFKFVEFTRPQIDSIMRKLQKRLKHSDVRYSFTCCRVYSDGTELKDYPLRCDTSASKLLQAMPLYVREAATRWNVQVEYHLADMTIFKNHESDTFGEEYHTVMKEARLRRQLHRKRRRLDAPKTLESPPIQGVT